jgi:hypothetical protein
MAKTSTERPNTVWEVTDRLRSDYRQADCSKDEDVRAFTVTDGRLAKLMCLHFPVEAGR